MEKFVKFNTDWPKEIRFGFLSLKSFIIALDTLSMTIRRNIREIHASHVLRIHSISTYSKLNSILFSGNFPFFFVAVKSRWIWCIHVHGKFHKNIPSIIIIIIVISAHWVTVNNEYTMRFFHWAWYSIGMCTLLSKMKSVYPNKIQRTPEMSCGTVTFIEQIMIILGFESQFVNMTKKWRNGKFGETLRNLLNRFIIDMKVIRMHIFG